MCRVFILIFLLLISSCAAYQPTGVTEAKIHFKMNDSLQKFHANQSYRIYVDKECSQSEETGLAANLATSMFVKKENVVDIPVEKRLYIQASNTIHIGGVGYSCMNIASFLPEKGITYTIMQKDMHPSCSLTIYDETGKTPEDVKIEDITLGCSY